MLNATHTVVVGKPPEEVFAFLADGTNAPKWRSGVLDIELQSGEGAGAVYRQGVKGPGSRRIPADYEVTVYEPPGRLAFQTIAGPVRPRGEFVLEPADGGTRVTFSLEAELNGLKKLVMERGVRRTMQTEVEAISFVERAIG